MAKIASIVIVLTLAGRLAASAIANEVCVIDDLSRRVCVPGPVTRVVSLAPNLTEIIFTLNAGSLLVGRSTHCNRPAEALKVPEIGSYLNPDLERVISLRPDLVVSTKLGTRKEFVQRLEEIGLPVFVDDSQNVDDIFELIKRMGILLAKESEATAALAKLELRRNEIRRRLDHVDKTSVLFVVGIRPLVVAGGKSFIGSLIREARGLNIAETAPIAFPKFSVEEVIRKDPRMILVLDKECHQLEDCVREWKRFPVLQAVKHDRIYKIDADLFARPSPGIVDALEKVAAILHPDMFDAERGEAQSTSR